MFSTFLLKIFKRKNIYVDVIKNIEKIIFNNPTKNAVFKSHKNAWTQLPK